MVTTAARLDTLVGSLARPRPRPRSRQRELSAESLGQLVDVDPARTLLAGQLDRAGEELLGPRVIGRDRPPGALERCREQVGPGTQWGRPQGERDRWALVPATAGGGELQGGTDLPPRAALADDLVVRLLRDVEHEGSGRLLRHRVDVSQRLAKVGTLRQDQPAGAGVRAVLANSDDLVDDVLTFVSDVVASLS